MTLSHWRIPITCPSEKSHLYKRENLSTIKFENSSNATVQLRKGAKFAVGSAVCVSSVCRCDFFGKMVTTRSRSRAQLRGMAEHFPEELWIEVLSHLGGKDIGRAVCATQVFANVRESVWRSACERRWPAWSQVAASADTQWKRQYELLELREKEVDAVPCVQAINKLQKVVNPRHRMVLTEWLAEVGIRQCLVYSLLKSLDLLHKLKPGF